MISIAIIGVNQHSRRTKALIEQLYNLYVKKSGSGDELQVCAYIDIYSELNDTSLDGVPVLKAIEVKSAMKEGLIGAAIIPRLNFHAQWTLYYLRMMGIGTDMLYVVDKKYLSDVVLGLEDAENLFVHYYDDSYLPYLEYHIEDACNLNCKACEHYAALVPGSVQPDFDSFSDDFVRFKELIQDVGVIRILGGEPLMNSELSRYVTLTRDIYPDSKIFVVTNGLLIKSMPDDLFRVMEENNVAFSISLYQPVAGSIDSICDHIKQRNVMVEVTPVINTFSVKQNIIGRSDKHIQFDHCFQSECHNIYRGRIAACYLPFMTHYFNECFNTAIPKDGSLSLYEPGLDTHKLKAFLATPFERCRYCNAPVDIPWDRASDTPVLSDWIIEDDRPLITIYTQSYNGEKFIAECIESILNQTYANFEYYVCNHGSKDDTLSIIKSYAEKDSRIHVMDMPNSARGFYPDYMLEHGKGKYFTMIDSDDYLAPDYLEKLVSYAEKNDLDMVCCGVYYFEEDDPERNIRVLRSCDNDYFYDLEENQKYLPRIYNFLRTTWAKIVRMEAMRQADYSIYKLNAQAFISDDTAFTLANYMHCRRVGCITDKLIYYRQNSASVTAKYNPALIPNNRNIYLLNLSLLKNVGDQSDSSLKYMETTYLESVCYTIEMIHKSTLDNGQKLKEYGRLFEVDEFLLIAKKNMSNVNFVRALAIVQTDVLSVSEPEETERTTVRRIVECIGSWMK